MSLLTVHGRLRVLSCCTALLLCSLFSPSRSLEAAEPDVAAGSSGEVPADPGFKFVHNGLLQSFENMEDLEQNDYGDLESLGLTRVIAGLDVLLVPSLEKSYRERDVNYLNEDALLAWLDERLTTDTEALAWTLGSGWGKMLAHYLLTELWVIRSEKLLPREILDRAIESLLDTMSKGHRAYLKSREGFGESGDPAEGMDIPAEAELWYQEALGLEAGALWVHWKTLADRDPLVYNYLVLQPRYSSLLARLETMRAAAIERALEKALASVASDPWFKAIPGGRIQSHLWPKEAGLLDEVSVSISVRTLDEYGSPFDLLVPVSIWEDHFQPLTTDSAMVSCGGFAPVDIGAGSCAMGRIDIAQCYKLSVVFDTLYRFRAARLGIPRALFEMVYYESDLLERVELLQHAYYEEQL